LINAKIGKSKIVFKEEAIAKDIPFKTLFLLQIM
jgi:hypothetical protein